MKKIIIFYAAYGGGHLSAAKSLEDYFKKNFENVEIELIDCMKYINKTVEKVTTMAYREMAKKAPWAWGKLYYDSKKGPISTISTKANSFMAIKLLKLLKEKQPDMIISTHPFGSQMCCYLKRKAKLDAKIATVMTDFKSHDQWLIGYDYTDLFFVADNDMKEELVKKGILEDKIFVTGIPISNKFSKEYDKKKILNDLNFTDSKKIILFFGGGEFGLAKTMTLDVFNCLVSKFRDTQIIAISGKNENLKNKFSQIVLENDRTNNVKIFEYTNKVAEIMSISDLVITKPGGLTSSESLVSHIPMLIINPIPRSRRRKCKFSRRK